MHFLTPVLAEELPPTARHCMSVTFEVWPDAGIIARCASHQFVQKVRWRGGLGRPAGEFHLLTQHRPAMWWDNQLWMGWYFLIFEKPHIQSLSSLLKMCNSYMHVSQLEEGYMSLAQICRLKSVKLWGYTAFFFLYHIVTCYDSFYSRFCFVLQQKKALGLKILCVLYC